LKFTHLNFFKGFEYDPTPELEAMAMVVFVEREGGELRGIGVKNARRHRTEDWSRSNNTEHPRRLQWPIRKRTKAAREM
jgi:hypothetical protein